MNKTDKERKRKHSQNYSGLKMYIFIDAGLYLNLSTKLSEKK